MNLFIRLILSFTLIPFLNLLSQTPDADPEVMFDLLVYDNGTVPGQKILEFGVDQTGSDSLDLDLGELELPPPPPAGVFFTRFFLPEGNFSGIMQSFRDIRNSTAYPYTGTHEYRVKYQVSEGANQIVFKWNLPPEVTGLFQDLVGGVIVNKVMTGEDSVIITILAIDQLKMIINYNSILPVELSSFTSRVIGRKVILEWRTESEVNNAGFEVERRTYFASEWEKVAFIPGNGSTTESHNYSYTDHDQLMFRSYYYRLKQIDYSGAFNYSNEIFVELSFPNSFKLNQNYPNPFNPSTTISFSIAELTSASLIIYNSLGEKVTELVNKDLEPGQYTYTWNASEFTSGVYLFELKTDQSNEMKKMLLIK